MVNKKYILLAGVCGALAMSSATAQSTQSSWTGRDLTYRGVVYDALDTAYIPASRQEQQQQYLNHQYAFPAKPRNMWEIGVNVGNVNIFADVASKGFWNAPKFHQALSYGLTVRKALGYATSLRFSYNYLNAVGYDYRSREVAAGSTDALPWVNNGFPAGSLVKNNYKFRGHEMTLQLVGAINNIKFHKAKNSASLYGFIGGGFMIWQTNIATRHANGNPFDFNSLNGQTAKDINTTYKGWLKDADFDVQYTRRYFTNNGEKGMTWGPNAVSPVLVGGLGIQFKLGDRVSLSIEDKITYTGLDVLDGVMMDPTPYAGLSPDKDVINNISVGLGFNIGNKKRSVLPLWWVNPLDHVYNEIADPRHMNLPAPILPDADGDGVTDQFDKCPDTPAGVPVDSHGCPLDTDGDGVPDYKDKQLITPTECQPVDRDGVGKCPCPDGCETAASCNIAPAVITFTNNSAKLNTNSMNQLAVIAASLKGNPDCKVVVLGNAGNSKLQQQRSWDRVNAIIEYLSNELQISRSQFIFQYQGGSGDVNSVIIRSALPGEEGPSNIPPPHPHLGTSSK